MKSHFRLAFSMVFTVTLHWVLLVNSSYSSAPETSTQSFTLPLNLNTLVIVDRSAAKQEVSKELLKSVPISNSSPNKIKQNPVNKKQNFLTKSTSNIKSRTTHVNPVKDKKMFISTTEGALNHKKVSSIPKASKSMANSPPLRKMSSITRDKHVVFLYKPKFKNLPPPPVYPRRARLRGQQGTAVIHAQLNLWGEVIKTQLAKSSGFALLDKAALKAVNNWDFIPGKETSGSVQVWVEIPVRFTLNSLKAG